MGGIVTKNAFLPPSPYEIENEEGIVYVETKSKHKTPLLFFKSNDANKLPFTIIFSHGNAEDLGSCSHWLRHMAKSLRVDVVGYDYSGYGYSKDQNGNRIETPSEKFCYENIEAVYDYLVNDQNIPADQIIIFGRSLGTGVTTHFATKRPVKGVLLQSPLLSAVRVVLSTPLTLPIDIFANCDKAHKIKSPTFIFHGTSDAVISVVHGVELHKLIKKPYAYKPWWIEGAGHNDIESNFGREYFAKISEFLEYLQEYKPEEPEEKKKSRISSFS